MTWTTAHLQTVLSHMRARRGDTTSIEVKRASGGLPALAETICAFANMPTGGTIILGVDEAQGAFRVTGVDDVAAMAAGLANTARQSVTPSPHISTEELQAGDATVLVAHVAPLRLSDRPATTGGRAYLRQADGDYVMQEHELRMIEIAKLHTDEQVEYDLSPARGRSRADLLPDLVDAYLTTARAHDHRLRERSDEQILQVTNVLTASGVPTLAGLYALGDYPQGQYPALTVTAAVQLPGGEGQPRNRNLQDFTGPVPVLLEGLMEWVRDNVDTVRRYRDDGHMEAMAEVPLNAVRELLANALIHRDLGPSTLGVGKAIQVRLTPRNLFIQSPGGLRGVSLAQLTSSEHAQAAVNQRLYQIAKKLATPDGAAIIEGEGGGISAVFRAARARGLPRPQLIDTGVQFKALLWRPDETARGLQPEGTEGEDGSHTAPKSSTPTRHEARVLRTLSHSEGISIHDLAAESSLNIGQVRYALKRPLAEGVVLMEGRQGDRTTTYRLASQP
ncbi:ATP-binding protein [Kytococcus sp. Marseille-QA3725]